MRLWVFLLSVAQQVAQLDLGLTLHSKAAQCVITARVRSSILHQGHRKVGFLKVHISTFGLKTLEVKMMDVNI